MLFNCVCVFFSSKKKKNLLHTREFQLHVGINNFTFILLFWFWQVRTADHLDGHLCVRFSL